MDSKEGTLEESEEAEDRVGEGGWESLLSEVPSLNILAKSPATTEGLPLGGDPFGDIES